MKIFILLYVFISKAMTKPFGEFCNWKGDCNDGFICEMEDKIFNPKRICSCPNDLDWVQGGSKFQSCVDFAKVSYINHVATKGGGVLKKPQHFITAI